MVSRLECTQVHFVKVSVSVSRPKKVLTTTLILAAMEGSALFGCIHRA